MAAGPNLSTNLGLGQLPEVDEFKHPSIFRDLVRVHSAIAGLQYALDAYTGNINYDSATQPQLSYLSTATLGKQAKIFVVAEVGLSPGQPVNLRLSGGVTKARIADALSPGIPCRGICTSASAVAAGALAEVTLFGAIGGFGGLTIGVPYYLAVGGGITTISPVGPDLIQVIGFPLSATIFFFNPAIV